MSNSRNHVQLIGHLGADPKMKEFQNGNKSVTLRMATSERYKVKDQWKTDTQWHQIVGWNKIAEQVSHQLKKGAHVLIEGKLIHRNYEDKTGKTRYITEIQLRQFVPFLNNKDTASNYKEDPAKSKINLAQQNRV